MCFVFVSLIIMAHSQIQFLRKILRKTNKKEFLIQKCYVKANTVMGKTADFTVVQQPAIDALHKQGKQQMVNVKGTHRNIVYNHNTEWKENL